MKRVDYLATLGVVCALLIGEINGTIEGVGTTDPEWVGLLMRVLYVCAYYMLFGSIITCIAIGAAALYSGTPSRLFHPTILAAGGVATYILMIGIYDACVWFLIYETEVDGKAITYDMLNHETRVRNYVARTVPYAIFLVGIGPYVYWLVQRQYRDAEALRQQGIQFEDGETFTKRHPSGARVVLDTPTYLRHAEQHALSKTHGPHGPHVPLLAAALRD